MVSVVVAWQDHIGSFDVQPWLLQAFLAITGATALLFGALMDANRAQLKRLRASSRMKARLHHHLALAAGGNLARDTNERQRIAGALHDEFGQNLTAFQTHLRLLKPEFTRANRLKTPASAIRSTFLAMRDCLRLCMTLCASPRIAWCRKR